MQDEAEVNRIFRKALDWGTKISDPQAGEATTTVERPFDGFGILNALPLYWEGKHIKGGLRAFNLGDIKDHQIANLLAIKAACPIAQCWIVLGVSVARGDNRFYVWDDVKAIASRRLEHRNFLKKELETLPYYRVYKGAIDLSVPPSGF